MPALSSSPIDPVLAQLAAAADTDQVSSAGLRAALRRVPDPRKRRGVRHQISIILMISGCAVMAGARSFAAIGEWAAHASDQLLAVLGVGLAPSESTIRRTLQRLDGDALDAAIGAWAAESTQPPAGTRRALAVDGKTLRGSGSDRAEARHLLAAIDHRAGVVLGQIDVAAKTNEIPMFSQLLDRIGDLTDTVVTADAMHAQRGHADYLVLQRDAHYLLSVKANQPTLHAQLKALPWKDVPIAHSTTGRGHGRIEKRSVKVVTVATGILFPHARQAIQITRKTRPIKTKTKKWSSTEVVYAVSSLSAEQAKPAELANWLRGHWAAETRLHWVRDVTFGEDHSQIRTGTGPRAMASLRNLVVSILRINGATNIAQALRRHAWDPLRPVRLLMIS